MKSKTSLILALAAMVFPAIALADRPAANPSSTQPSEKPEGAWVQMGPSPASGNAAQGEGAGQFGAPRAFVAPSMVRIANPAMMIKAPYVGIDAVPAGAALDSQLKLPKNTGLLVNYVDPQGPARAAGLEPNDILTKLNDQILIDTRQLSVLVRDTKAGDEIKLTLIREGQEQVISIKPVEKEVYDFMDLNMPQGGNPGWQMIPQQGTMMPGGAMPALPGAPIGTSAQARNGATDLTVMHDGRTAHLHMDRAGLTMTITENGQTKEYKAADVHELQKNNPEAYKLYMEFFGQAAAPPSGTYIVRIHSRDNKELLPPGVQSQEYRFDDGADWKITRDADGKGIHLLATDKDGKSLFDGPITTPDQRKALPAEIREKLNNLSPATPAGEPIQFRIDGD